MSRLERLECTKKKEMEGHYAFLKRYAFLERRSPASRANIAHTERQLGVYVSAEETQRLTRLARELRNQLAALTAEWEELTMQLEGA